MKRSPRRAEVKKTVRADEALYALAFDLMSEQMQQAPAERSARRLTADVTRRGYEPLVYGSLLPAILKVDSSSWPAVRAAMMLGSLLEQLRRMPLILQDRKRQQRAGERNKRDAWLAEVESRPPGVTVAAVYERIANREGWDTLPESVKASVSKARRSRRNRERI